jgi:hypothetical protein
MKKFSRFLSSQGRALGIIVIAFVMIFLASCSKDAGGKVTPPPNPDPTPTPPAKTIPGIFSNIKVTPGNKTVSVNGDTTSNGGSKITGYTVQVVQYETKWVGTGYNILSSSVVKTVTSSTLPIVIDALTNMATYSLVVKVNNTVGPSGPSDSVGFVTMLPITQALSSSYVVLDKRQKQVSGTYVDEPASPGLELIKYMFFPNGKWQMIILPGNPLYVGADTASYSIKRGDWSIDDQNTFIFRLNNVNPTLTIQGEMFVYEFSLSGVMHKEFYKKVN